MNDEYLETMYEGRHIEDWNIHNDHADNLIMDDEEEDEERCDMCGNSFISSALDRNGLCWGCEAKSPSYREDDESYYW